MGQSIIGGIIAGRKSFISNYRTALKKAPPPVLVGPPHPCLQKEKTCVLIKYIFELLEFLYLGQQSKKTIED